MLLSVIIPTYNEQETIAEILRRVRLAPVGDLDKQIIVVDDCSTDGTRQILEQEKGTDLTILYHHRNMGKGAAVRTGLEMAKGDIILIQDADLEYDPEDYPQLLRPILKGKAKVVYGSRFLGEHKAMLFWHAMGNNLLTFITNLLYDTTLTDMETCYKVFTREVARQIKLRSPRWGFDPEITAKILKHGYRIYEVPISYSGREYAEGKKITWRDGLTVLWTLLKYRFSD
ncbi:MAG: glycosyltransferase family 2 protein [Chloroflexi bacterium]|nr:glycosyltransferase family 2 protein [Chloroflexota bacterium]MCL5076053.1 glycosyltransferase family 2 protein [Chloroflexota bacterium]